MAAHGSARRSGALVLLTAAALLAGSIVAGPAQASALSSPPVRTTAEATATKTAGAPASSITATKIRRLIVKTSDGSAPTAAIGAQAQKLAAVARAGSIVRTRTGGGGTSVLDLSAPITTASALSMSAALAARPDVLWAEPDWPMQVAEASPVSVNDPSYQRQWGLWDPDSPVQGGYSIHAPQAWQVTTGSSAVVVAVLDTGITDHPDLNSQVVQQGGADYGYDMIDDLATSGDGNGGDADPHDPGDFSTGADCGPSSSSWHGTHVAGIIAAAQDNEMGVSGVAPGVRLEPVRVLGTCGGFTSDVADGIRWAAGGPNAVPGVPDNQHPAAVINLSLGGESADCPQDYQSAIDYARSRGAVVVVAAGNSSSPATNYTPANCHGVITTVATGRSGEMAYYSNFGVNAGDVQIAAPGGNQFSDEGIYSTYNSGTQGPQSPSYADLQGTSMATPQVSGVVALMLSVRSMTPDQVLQILQDTATPFPAQDGLIPCTVPVCGAGLVDAAAAVAAANGGVSGAFRSVPAARVIDTRQTGRPMTGGSTTSVGVGGRNGVPLGASAVVVTVTAVLPKGDGFLTVFPTGLPRPRTSNLNFAAGRTVAGSVILPLGVNGDIDVYNGTSGSADLLVDVTGYFLAGAAVAPGTMRTIPATRILDSRTAAGGGTPLAPSATRVVTVSGVAGVPAGSTAVVLNVTATRPTAAGFLSVWRTGLLRPATSILNFPAGGSVTNMVIAKVDGSGDINIFNGSAGSTDVIVDVAGYIVKGSPTAAGAYHPLDAVRALDTRIGAHPIGPLATSTVAPTAVPSTASGVVGTLTVVTPAQSGSLTAFPAGAPRPTTSNLNFGVRRTAANLAVIGGPAWAVRNNCAAPTDVLLDVSGYFS